MRRTIAATMLVFAAALPAHALGFAHDQWLTSHPDKRMLSTTPETSEWLWWSEGCTLRYTLRSYFPPGQESVQRVENVRVEADPKQTCQSILADHNVIGTR